VLSQNELLVFLALIGSTTMIGLDEEPLAGMDEKEVAERLNGGEQSLVSRGLLIFDDEQQATLDDMLVALVGGASVPDATLQLTHLLPGGGVRIHYFHATPELLIEQTTPRTGIHHFQHISSSQMLTYRLQALLASLHTHVNEVTSVVSQQLPAAVLAQVFERRQKRQPTDLSVQVLRNSGLSPEIAAEIARDFSVHPTWIGITIWGLRSVQPAGARTSIAVLGTNHCWSIEDIDDDASQVRIIPTTGLACEAKFLALIEPLLEIVQQSRSGI
jgi:hypothetical protein